MPHWYYPYLLLIALMVTSFTINGALALWAATSREHRLLLALVVLLIPAPLLLRPALALYSVFAIQTLLVIAGVALYRWRTERTTNSDSETDRRAPRSRLQLRFSLFTLLTLMMAVGVGLTAVTQLPKWENLAWRTVLVSSVGATVGTLAAAWLCNTPRKWLALGLGVTACVVIGAGVSELDWFFEAILQMAGWPPRAITPEIFMGSPANYDDYDAWCFIPLLIALSTALLIFIQHRSRRAFIVSALIFAALPLATMMALLLPAPIPTVAIPAPNGHDDFMEAGRIANEMKFNVSDIDHATADQLDPFVVDADKVDALVISGLAKPRYVPSDYFSLQPTLANTQVEGYYAVEMALTSKGRLAVLDDRYDAAAEFYLRAIEFGFAASRGGMVWDGALVRSRSAFGARPLYAIRTKLSDEQLANCVSRLAAMEATDEPMDDVLYRHRVWSERRNGWHGHLKFLLEQATVREGDALSTDYWHRTSFRNDYRWIHAVARLMICEFALMRYHREHNVWPAKLTDLVPDYMPAVPVDPFDPPATPLRYRREGEGYQLYSINRDGVDHNGQPTHPAHWDVKEFRDLRLDYALHD